MKPSQDSYSPSHPGLFIVEFGNAHFSSSLKALRPFQAGETIAAFEGLTRGTKAYTSVQCGPGPDDHFELNSDLVYVNHSCEPNVAFDVSASDSSKWHVRALKTIQEGDTLTFFYPSTEWDMEQTFNCECGTQTCLGHIRGAKFLPRSALDARGFVNTFIDKLVTDRDILKPRGRNSPESDKAVCFSCGYGFSARGDFDRCGCKP